MMYINSIPHEDGSYNPPQSSRALGLLAFPDEFMSTFYMESKEASGFVTIEDDGQIVTSCKWNEEAYQAYIANLPEPAEPKPEPSQLDIIEAQVTYTAMMTDTLLEV